MKVWIWSSKEMFPGCRLAHHVRSRFGDFLWNPRHAIMSLLTDTQLQVWIIAGWENTITEVSPTMSAATNCRRKLNLNTITGPSRLLLHWTLSAGALINSWRAASSPDISPAIFSIAWSVQVFESVEKQSQYQLLRLYLVYNVLEARHAQPLEN